MKKVLYSAAIAALILSSCNNSNAVKDLNQLAENTKKLTETPAEPAVEMQAVAIKDQYTLDIPNFMTEATGLHEEASLQYQNIFKETYVVVIDEPTADFDKALKEHKMEKTYGKGLEAYSKVVKENFTVEQAKMTEFKPTTIDGNEAMTMEIEGKVDGHDVYYQMAVVKGKNSYYQILTWTLLNKKDEFRPVFEKMINSFKEGKKSA